MEEPTCSVEGCVKPRRARGWCPMHYRRWRLFGDPIRLAEPPTRPEHCAAHGCDKAVLAKGWCSLHYDRVKRTGAPELSERPAPSACAVEGCGAQSKTRGWCGKHYQRWLAHGDPLGVPRVAKAKPQATPRRLMSPEDRFWVKVDKNGPVPAARPDLGPCWLWTGTKLPKGYGSFYYLAGRRAYAHRFAYELLVGPIPADRPQIDHLCRVTSCVNPTHLEPVTNRENTLRGLRPDQLRQENKARKKKAA